MIKPKSLNKKSSTGFTLIEMLLVIAIISILALTIFLEINPIEINKKSRDAVRLADLRTLNEVITISTQTASSSAYGNILCVNASTPCYGESDSSSSANRNNNGTGWVKVNLSKQDTAAYIPTLPIDPLNKVPYIYTYMANSSGWEIDAVLESDTNINKYKKMETDGGNNKYKYETGTNLYLMN